MDLRKIQSGGGGPLGALARGGLVASCRRRSRPPRTRAPGCTTGAGSASSGCCGRPVVAVGNVTAGGTGKTPFVAWLVATTRAVGRRPAILARGYGPTPAGSARSDEGTLLRELVGSDVPQVEDASRVRGAATLLAAHPEVDLVVLDDGFQHRRLARDVDIVLVDATSPFGGGHYLPRGLLRESPRALRRADVVVLTRTDAVDAPGLASLRARVAALAPRAEARARAHASHGLVGARRHAARRSRRSAGRRRRGVERHRQPRRVRGDPPRRRRARRVVAAGRRTTTARPPAELHAVVTAAERAGAAFVVVTRKDLVKLRTLASGLPTLLALDVETDVVEGREALLRTVAAAGRPRSE